MMTYVLEVEGVDEVGHVVTAPIGHLSGINSTVSFGSEIFLCNGILVHCYWLNLTKIRTQELDDRRMIGALSEDFSATSEGRDDK
jgi:hypothetical protein